MVMARKKGLPLGTFLKRFSSEAQCQEYLASLRWKTGYICPVSADDKMKENAEEKM